MAHFLHCSTENKHFLAVAEWVARQTAEQEVGSSMWGRRLAAMLALYTSIGVTPEVNLRECISHMPPQSLNKAEPTLALKPRGDVQNRGISGPTNGHVSNKYFKKIKKKHFLNFHIYTALSRRKYCIIYVSNGLGNEY